MSSSCRHRLAAFTFVMICACGILWWQRTPLRTWYYLHNLAGADEADRALWADRVASLEPAPVDQAMELLRESNVSVCANAEAALTALAKRWGTADTRSLALADDLSDRFITFSMPGQEAALEWYLVQIHESPKVKVTERGILASASKLVPVAAIVQAAGVRVRTLALAEVLLGRGEIGHVDVCRELSDQGLASSNAEVRSRAIRLLMHSPLHKEKARLDRLAPFLRDPSPEVRRAAVLTLGLAEETIGVQEILVLLHDSDAEVRRLCEAALRGRGLVDHHITMAKLISDDRPGQRLQVVHHLGEIEDLDPALWLMHLSRDASPAVRAAAIRFAAEDAVALGFRERMLQMSREDPSPTVRQLAEFYVSAIQRRK